VPGGTRSVFNDGVVGVGIERHLYRVALRLDRDENKDEKLVRGDYENSWPAGSEDTDRALPT